MRMTATPAEAIDAPLVYAKVWLRRSRDARGRSGGMAREEGEEESSAKDIERDVPVYSSEIDCTLNPHTLNSYTLNPRP